MKKLFFLLLATAAALPALAQADATEAPRESIVMGRYNDEMTEISPADAQFIQPYKKVWVGLDFGFSYRTARAAEGVERIFRSLRDGLYYGGDLHFSIGSDYLLGARYTGHRYAQSSDYRLNTHYFAPSLQWRVQNLRNGGSFYWGVSAGYLSYSEKSEWLVDGSVLSYAV